MRERGAPISFPAVRGLQGRDHEQTDGIIPRGERVSLSRYKVRPSIAVSDISRAAEFYEQRLGLPAGAEQSDESRIYACGGDTALHVYAAAHAGKPTATLAT